jgi:hypothetical protein
MLKLGIASVRHVSVELYSQQFSEVELLALVSSFAARSLVASTCTCGGIGIPHLTVAISQPAGVLRIIGSTRSR